jgi:signal peptidase I
MSAWHVVLVMLGFAQNYSVPTATMQPTISVGDKVTIPSIRLFRVGPRLRPDPVMGDVVVFYNAPTAEVYVKRVVGMAGDRVQMKAGRLHINGEPVPRAYVGEFEDRDSYGTIVQVKRYVETLPNGQTHLIHEIGDEQPLDNTAEYLVPDGSIFTMGDNRDRSADSRVLRQVGYVPLWSVIAKAHGDDQLHLWGKN